MKFLEFQEKNWKSIRNLEFFETLEKKVDANTFCR